MRSLKIIIFRDTDKPYTIIIPSYVLVTGAFLVISIFTLLAFSLVGNVMLYADIVDQRSVTSQYASADVGEETVTQAEDKPDQSNADDQTDSPEDVQLPLEERPVVTDTVDSGTSETTEEESENLDSEQLPAFSPGEFDYVDPSASVEAIILDDLLVTDQAVQFRAQVRKTDEMGVPYQGEFIAALADSEGKVDSVFPSRVNISEGEVSSPGDGNTFRISYRRNYNISLTKTPGTEYAWVLLYIYDNDTKELHWKKAIPIQ
jgi:hypothetical protein